ncbi:putative signal transduction protein (HD domain protein) [Desulforapulum autotrophicum HRM2]|uniref:Signal transduction protein (HD domain protein) n=1 Tax=Desulforapulum autotrophicum (strain ATCC 43914 / DSM 3382 / VKM B-1955 / HRM2) TaxID=177437 RepID=C0QLZ5_DESAH|nr:HDOD domain-containing protein [Desulforapulum autotrophicum]ACN14301.1 putative signal transduction protein (HD domain protein) [Desulforapulum autotrophicum HRM2]
MQEIKYRIIFRKLYSEDSKILGQYLIQEFKFSKEKIAHLINFAPSVLCDSPNKNRIKIVAKDLRAMGAGITIHNLVRFEKSSVFVDIQQLKMMSKVLSMSLRAGVDTALVYAEVQPSNAKDRLVSLIGRQTQIEEGFRDSDSVYVIDDNKIVFLGFSSDKSSCLKIIPKFVQLIEKTVENKAAIKTGVSIFPEDGYSFQELFHKIEKKLHPFAKDGHGALVAAKQTQAISHGAHQEFAGDYVYGTCFNNARGETFQKLLKMESDFLCYGLKQLSSSDQKKFFLRFPYNSSLSDFLSEKLEKPTENKLTYDPEYKFKAFFSEMQFEKKLLEIKKNQAMILTALNQRVTLSTIPSVALQVYRLALDPAADSDDIQKMVQLDQALTLKLLKIVNSAFYGLSQKIDSVKEAVVVLGTDEIINMALGLSLSKAFTASNLKGLIDPKQLWKHSVGTAFVGKYLCRKMEIPLGVDIFTACILHDFGKLFLIENCSDLYRKILEISKEKNLPVYDIEEEHLGFNHGRVGGIIAKKWNLPDSLVQAISFHHHPSSSEIHSRLAAITGTANALFHMAFDLDNNDNTNGLLKDHLEGLNSIPKKLDSRSIAEIVEEVRGMLCDNDSVFEIIS